MPFRVRSLIVAIATASLLAIAASRASAHFAWLAANDDGQAEFFFGESPAERAYHLPESLAEVDVVRRDLDVADQPVTMEPVETDDFIGLRSEDDFERRGVWTMTAPYGLYHGTMLTYAATCYASRIPGEWSQRPVAELPLQIIPRIAGDKLIATLYRDGQPLKHVKVMFYDAAGKLAANESTNDDGVAVFDAAGLTPGVNGFMAGVTDDDARGEFDGEKYRSAACYATTTFPYDPEQTMHESALPLLPDAIASFGAAVADGYVYLYGGHRGKAHDHSADNLSPRFMRARVDGSGEWEDLPTQTPLQGLALVAHGGKLYRIGGLNAKNAAGDDADLHSVDEFACFDPAAGEWAAMPALPAGRSSHDAAVVGDTLFVVGGWRLSGDSSGEWQAGALAFDLAKPESGWQELSPPPFKRRALAVAPAGEQLAVVCGMDDDGGVSKDVFLFDPASGEWSSGPEFPGESFHGFGVSACADQGALYACGMEGVVYRLAADHSEWEQVGKIAAPRFFHRILPAGDGTLLVVGGATAEEGHARSSERVTIDGNAAAGARTALRDE